MNINQSLNGFTNYIASQGGIPHLNRFAVEITKPRSLENDDGYKHVLRHLHFSARSVGLPSKSISTNAVLAAGPEQKYPYQDAYDDLTVTFMPTKGKGKFGLPERKFFEDWIGTIVDSGNMLVGFSDMYSTDLRLSILSDQRSTSSEANPSRLVQYKFDRAYPIAISEIQFAAAAHELMIFKVTFSYDRWNRVNTVENTPNPASVLPEPKNGEIPERPDRINTSKKTELKNPETPERPNRIWTSEVSGKYKHPVGVEHAKQASKDLERPNRVKKANPSKPNDPIERKVGGKANTPTPKKLTKAVLGRVANRARAELGIRPMLDE